MSSNFLDTIQLLSFQDWMHLAPMIILTISGLISLLLSTFHTKPAAYLNFAVFSVSCVAAVSILCTTASRESFSIQNGVFYFDSISTVFSILLIALAYAISTFELSQTEENAIGGEFLTLLAFALVGMIGLISTKDLMMLFICLELMSLATYVLIAMRRDSKESAESSLKYFIISGVMSSIFLMGISFLFGAAGSFNLADIRTGMAGASSAQHMILLFGILLIYSAMLFKVGAVPFHTWLPDVYSGASNSVSTFLITAIKVTAFTLIVRISLSLWSPNIFGQGTKMYQLLFLATVLSLAFGAFVGLRQNNLKRILAYSSIAHTGFILMALIGIKTEQPDAISVNAITAYLFFYVITVFGAFAFLHLLKKDQLESYDLKNLNGLFQRSPVVAICLTVFLLSMAGMPPTAGFFGKYYVILAALEHGERALAIIGILSSIISAYFYLRPIVHMFFKEAESGVQELYVDKLAIKFSMVGAGVLVFAIPYFFSLV